MSESASPRRPRICVIGSLNIDFVTTTPRVPGPGETLTATSLTVHPGGKGANQAVACGKAAFTSPDSQDVQIDMIGAVGAHDPYYASLLRPTLVNSGVNVTHVEELEGAQTGTATILVDEGANGENRILIVPGANAKVTDVKAIVDLKAFSDDRAPDVVVMQGEIPRTTVLHLLEVFNSSDQAVSVVFNPAPMYPDGIPLSALHSLAVLVVNETEFSQLLESIGGFETEDRPAELHRPELVKLTRKLKDMAGIAIVIVTLGSRGVFYDAGSISDLIPAVKVETVVDTTAAGDAFVGYIATSLARHIAKTGDLISFDMRAAADLANRAAAKCVQKSGAMESIPFGYE